MLLRKISIGKRAAGGFAAITLTLLLIGVLCLMQMAALNNASHQINEFWLSGITTLQKLNGGISTVRLESLRVRTTDDAAARRHSERLITDARQSIDSVLASYARRDNTPEERALTDALKKSLGGYFQALDQVLAQMNAAEADAALIHRMSAVMVQLGAETNQSMQALISLNESGADQAARRSEADYLAMQRLVAILLLVAVLATVALAWALTRSIVAPIRQALAAAQTIAGGDLSQPIHIEGQDEPAKLLEAMRLMQDNLRGTIRHISDSAQQLATATEEMSTVMQHSTRDLQKQNEEIDQAATAVTEMSSAVDEVANNATSTSELSRDSDLQTQEGHQQVSQTIELVQNLAREVVAASQQAQSLSVQARDISGVLDVIRNIADQTNLLALNAAIEAARAGENGRGFAVVADEVRSLALRTAASTMEIESMIQSIQNGTQATVTALSSSADHAGQTLERAHAAGEALAQITLGISQINERNLVIASAAEQQAQVAREVDRNLTSIRELSLQSATGATQTQVASHELSRLAVQLNQTVVRFAL